MVTVVLIVGDFDLPLMMLTENARTDARLPLHKENGYIYQSCIAVARFADRF
jgi:hypothetical protein